MINRNLARCGTTAARNRKPAPDNTEVSKAKILGNSELFIKSGSDINLTCVALQSPAPPSFIYWYKGGRVVNYSQRGGISVLTERQTKTSKLVIARAMPSDSGNYTCSPSSSAQPTAQE
uniref:Ig-like domain-containing protein n=1 Tax=Anopheles epiroticus TaxID=199890 RepID=A0A182PRT4_9DIPT